MKESIEKFQNILYEDEKVVDATFANKKSYVIKRVLAPFIVFLVVTIILTIIAAVFPRHYVEETTGFWAEPAHYEGFPLWVLFLVSGILLCVVLLVGFIAYKSAKNYHVCLTNKRIIIRHGAFTTDYTFLAIDKVSGNITIRCNQSIFDKKNSSICALIVQIELLPVGHSGLIIATPSIIDGYEFSKKIDKQVKENAKSIKMSAIEE